MGKRVVAGVDLAAGRGTTEVALLELSPGTALPIFRAESHRAVSDDDEILSVLAEARPKVIAIDAPLSLPRAVAAAVRDDGRTVDGSRGFLVVPDGSPYTRAAERDPIWRELGVRPLPVSFLGGLTFRAIALVPKLRALLPESAVIEVFPTATLRALGIRLAVKGERREAKTSATARATTQQGLSRSIRGLPAPATQPLGADLLDALAAGLTAVAYLSGQFRAIGDAGEGQIVLPDPGFGASIASVTIGRIIIR